MDINDVINDMNNMYLGNNNEDIKTYIINLTIDEYIKKNILNLIDNDNYSSYIDIYNICIENDIELPPI